MAVVPVTPNERIQVNQVEACLYTGSDERDHHGGLWCGRGLKRVPQQAARKVVWQMARQAARSGAARSEAARQAARP
eukprot:2421037-Prymnesium_polylepis.1